MRKSVSYQSSPGLDESETMIFKGPSHTEDHTYDPASDSGVIGTNEEYWAARRPSNTPPQTSIALTSTGGEDWGTIGYWVKWSHWAELKPVLETATLIARDKKYAKDTGGDIIMFGEQVAHVLPSGEGKGNYGPRCSYNIRCAGLSIGIADRRSPKNDRTPNVYITVTGDKCLERGFERCLALARDLISRAGGIIQSDMLSRVDLCLDLPGVAIDDLYAAFKEERFVRRAKSDKVERSPGVTISFGNSPIQLKIYNKRAQLMDNGDTRVIDLMIARRYNMKLPEEATRVEFELRREALKSHGINSVADYFTKRGDLLAFLCRKWIRFTSQPVDRTNTARAKTLPLWAEITEGFMQWAGQPRGESLAPLPRHDVDVVSLMKQIRGVTLAAAVERGARADTPEEFWAFLKLMLTPFLDPVYLRAEMARRSAKTA